MGSVVLVLSRESDVNQLHNQNWASNNVGGLINMPYRKACVALSFLLASGCGERIREIAREEAKAEFDNAMAAKQAEVGSFFHTLLYLGGVALSIIVVFWVLSWLVKIIGRDNG